MLIRQALHFVRYKDTCTFSCQVAFSVEYLGAARKVYRLFTQGLRLVNNRFESIPLHSGPDWLASHWTTMADPIIVRSARLADVDCMTDVFSKSFNQKFWTYVCPDNSSNRRFINDMWIQGIHDSTDRTFVAVDTADSNRIIGVSRWQVPLHDQSAGCDSWPEPSILKQDIAVSLFRAEDSGRRAIMGDRPHWCK